MHIERSRNLWHLCERRAAPLQHVIDKALAKSLAERYQTAEEMRRDLLAVKADLIGEDVDVNYHSGYTEPLEPVGPEVADFQGEEDATRVMSPMPSREELVEQDAKTARKKKIKKILMYCLSGFYRALRSPGRLLHLTTPNVEVPAVTGLTVVEAQKVLEDAGFKIKLKEAYDASVTPGTVMKQDPAPKTMKKSGATVTITICRGLEILTVPNVTGQTLDQAKQNLEAAGYKVGNVTKTWDSSKSKDVVLKQSPKADSKLPKGTAIDLVVNEKEDEKPKKAQMPNIVGLSLESGQDKLSALGLNIGELKTVDSDKPANIIVAMSPEAGYCGDQREQDCADDFQRQETGGSGHQHPVRGICGTGYGRPCGADFCERCPEAVGSCGRQV
jgi:hypothetical protein